MEKFTNATDDWDAIAAHLENEGSIFFTYSFEGEDVEIMISSEVTVMGDVSPQGGSYVVALRGLGMDTFDLDAVTKEVIENSGLNITGKQALGIGQMLACIGARIE